MIAREFNYNTTKIMGVINVTPDSFSDGGNFYSPEAALKQALKLEKEGADILDIGAESSRPGSEPIDAKTEWERLGPALSAIKQNCKNIKISVDSYRPETILRAVEEFGIDYVNCIKGVLEFSLLQRLAKVDHLNFIAMHMQGSPKNMQKHPLKGGEVVAKLKEFFKTSILELKRAGFSENRIFLDPGIGFGKSDAANLKLLQWMPIAQERYSNVVVGISRKSMFSRILEIQEPMQRDAVSKMVELGLLFAGVSIIRTHDVAALVKIKKTWLQDD